MESAEEEPVEEKAAEEKAPGVAAEAATDAPGL